MDEARAWGEANTRFGMRMAKVLVDPLRIRILEELNKKVMSPKQFLEACGGGSIARVWRHFQILLDYGWIEKVEEKTGGERRGATEHFYRAVRPAVFDTETWTLLPKSMKEEFSTRILKEFNARVIMAMTAGTLDARPERHFSCIPVLLDETGMKNVIARVDALFDFVFEEQAAARSRLEASGEKGIPGTVGLAAFESPQDDAMLF